MLSAKVNSNIVLFLNENPLPSTFTHGTISGKELRLRSAIQQISEIHVIAPKGFSIQSESKKVGHLEAKITIHTFNHWPYYLRFIPLFFLGLTLSLQLKPSTIEAESPIISGLSAVIISKILRIPSIIELRSDFKQLLSLRIKYIPLVLKNIIFHLVHNFTLRHANYILANSNHLYNLALKQNSNVSIINPGIQYPPTQVRSNNSQPFTIGYLGRLVPEKGVPLLLHATAKLQSHHHLKSFQLLIVGDGPDISKLQQLSKELGIDSITSFLGMSHNFSALAKFHVLVNPILIQPPLEMVNAEAAYMQVPVICFGNKSLPETVVHNRTGIKVKNINSKALSVAIANLIKDDNLRKKLSENSHQFAIKNFSFKNQVEKLIEVYSDLNLFSLNKSANSAAK